MNAEQEALKRRNYRIVGIVGGFVFPIAGAIGAAMLFAQGDRDLGRTTAIASAVGAVAYAIVFLAL